MNGTELLALRRQAAAVVDEIDRLLAQGEESANPLRWRVTPGGMLNPEGVAEINRRFEAGQDDAAIAQAMHMTVPGVQQRREIWKREQSPHAQTAQQWRSSPGGFLNEEGNAELRRLFEAGKSDEEISHEMVLSLRSVRERRAKWKAEKISG